MTHIAYQQLLENNEVYRGLYCKPYQLLVFLPVFLVYAINQNRVGGLGVVCEVYIINHIREVTHLASAFGLSHKPYSLLQRGLPVVLVYAINQNRDVIHLTLVFGLRHKPNWV